MIDFIFYNQLLYLQFFVPAHTISGSSLPGTHVLFPLWINPNYLIVYFYHSLDKISPDTLALFFLPKEMRASYDKRL